MVGKTPAEVSALARQLAEVASRNLSAPTPQYQQPQFQPGPYTPPGPDDYLTGAHLQQAGQQYLQQAQQFAQPAYEMVASTNLEMVKGKYAKEFAKYGPEIMGTLSRVPKTDWSIDNISRVVKLALVDHLDDLANERAAQIASSQDSALRSTGANGSTIPSQQAPDQGLTEQQRETLRRRGITPEAVRSFAAAKGMTEQQWFEKAGKYGIGDAT
jgi:hypothetical protein